MERTVGSDEPLPMLNTADGQAATGAGFDPDSNLLRPKASLCLADVAAHMINMKKLVRYDDVTDSSSGVDKKPLSSEEIRAIEDATDQVYYWALAESHFPDDGSALCECEAVEVVGFMLAHDRSPVVLAALRSLIPLMKHNMNRKIFLRLKSLTSLLTAPLVRFPNKVEVQEGTMHLISIVAQEPSLTEAILRSELVSAVLSGMAKHGQYSIVQHHGCAVFAALVNQPREGDTPVAIIFAHVGSVLELLLKAATRHPTNLEIGSSVACVLEAMSEFPQNFEALSGTSTMAVCSAIVSTSMHTPPTLRSALTTLSNLVGEMMPMQKRSLVLLVKKVMSSTDDTTTLATCCALCSVIITSYDPARRFQEKVAMAHRDKVIAMREEFDRGQGGGNEKAGQTEEEPEYPTLEQFAGEGVIAHDQEEEAEWRNEQLKMKQFMSKEIVPFIALALEHFGVVDSVLVRAGEGCLRQLCISKWDF